MSQDWPRWMIHAQDVGLIGPASLRFHHEHALGFAAGPGITTLLTGGREGGSDEKTVARDDSRETRAIDLGSGGGLPGLVLAQSYPSSTWTLLDARKRSQEHLEAAIVQEGLEKRVAMVVGRAETLGREADLREQFDLATARGFAKPGITAELAAGFLTVGGTLVVSEPPEEVERWPAEFLGEVGLEAGATWSTDVGHYRSFHKIEAVSDRYPRRVGIPEKRPLF